MITDVWHLTRPTEVYVKTQYQNIADLIKETNLEILQFFNYPPINEQDTKVMKRILSPFSRGDNHVYDFLKQQEKYRTQQKTQEQLYRQKINEINTTEQTVLLRIIKNRLKSRKQFDKYFIHNIKVYLKELFDINKTSYYSIWHNLFQDEAEILLYKELFIAENEKQYKSHGNLAPYITDQFHGEEFSWYLEDIIKSDKFYHIDRSLMKEIKWTIEEYIDKVYIQKLKIAYNELLIKRKACLQDLKNINLQIEKDYNNAILEFQN